MSQRPYVSVVLATYNRREAVVNTLDQLERCGLDRRDYEVIVVDNCSTDGTDDALAGRSGVTHVRLDQNMGSCAKAVGVDRAKGPLLLFLDDDSYPRPDCMKRMLDAFERHRMLAAAGFTVHLPDDSQECSALPHVFVGCGVGLRTRAVRHVGGLDRTFFMQAEEYDLSFRLLQAGMQVEVFADLQVDHLKSPQARRSERTTLLDIRNNLRVIGRYLPQPAANVYAQDWIRRYAWMAASAGHSTPFRQGLARGKRLAHAERRLFKPWRMSQPALEQVFSWRLVSEQMAELAATGVRRIVLADLGKNAYAFVRAAGACGVQILALADNRFATQHRRYRGVPIVTVDEAYSQKPDAVVIANTSYVHATRRAAELEQRGTASVYNWFPMPTRMTTDRARSTSRTLASVG
ncbi:MAG: glycosyltransferase family 2 protein [Phycisphaerae bacterium]